MLEFLPEKRVSPERAKDGFLWFIEMNEEKRVDKIDINQDISTSK